jgi:hypothetical protein
VPALRLNVLPVVVDDQMSDAVFHLPHSDGVFEKLRESQGQDGSFNFLRHDDRIYVWPKPGQAVPASVDLSRAATVLAASVPTRVLAHAIREAAVDRLTGPQHGFERLRGYIFDPVRLFRRRRNLAASGTEQLADEAGVFPYLMLQGIVLHHETATVALVVDVGLVNRLDVPLRDLAAAGIGLTGMSVDWEHEPNCSCLNPTETGRAGAVVGGDPGGAIEIKVRCGVRETVSARCLVARPNRHTVENYITSMSDHDVSQIISAAVKRFHAPDEQWKMVEAARKLLQNLPVFASSVVTIDPPITATAGATGDVIAFPPLSNPALNFRYGSPTIATHAAKGLTQHGPYDKLTSRTSKVNALVLCPAALVKEAARLKAVLSSGIERFRGLEERFSLDSLTINIHQFSDDTAHGYASEAEQATRPTDETGKPPDIVYVITREADREAKAGENSYLAAKAVLANAGLASQAVRAETLHQSDSSLQWTADQIALQSYVKIGNIPYVLHDPGGVRELVIGVGRHDIRRFDAPEQLFGVAAAFRQDGDFLFAGSTAPVVPQDEYESSLSALIADFIERFAQSQGAAPERVVIHLFKRTGWREVSAIETALAGQAIEWALLQVNRDTPLWLVQTENSRVEPAAVGSVVQIGDGDRLLMTGNPTSGLRRNRNPHPLRLTLDRDSTFRDMDRLTEQVLGFTAVSGRSFFTTYEPSTILYGRLLAEKVAQLEPYGFKPERSVGIGDRPWFL